MESAIVVAIIAGCVSIVSAVINIIANKSKAKQEHEFKVEDTQTEWQKSVDQKLATDKARIDTLTVEVAEQKKMDKMLLRGTMLITQHLVDNNHTEKLKEYTHEVDEFLIERS